MDDAKQYFSGHVRILEVGGKYNVAYKLDGQENEQVAIVDDFFGKKAVKGIIEKLK